MPDVGDDRSGVTLALSVPEDLANLLIANGCARPAPALTFRAPDPINTVPAIIAAASVAASAVTLILQGRDAWDSVARCVVGWLSRKGDGSTYEIQYRHDGDSVRVALASDTDPALIAEVLGAISRVASGK